MTVRGYVSTFRRRWRFVVVPLVVCVGFMALMSVVLPRQYESTTTIYVASTSDGRDINRDFQGTLLAQQRMASYTQILTSTQVSGEVVRRLGLDLSAEDVAAMMSTTRDTDSSVMTLTVESRSPEQSAAIARAATETFLLLTASFEQPIAQGRPPAIVPRVLDQAEVPEAPSAPQPALLLALGFMGGLLTGITAALVRDATDNRIRTPDDLAEAGERPVLGVLPEEDRADAERDVTRSAEAIKKFRADLKFAAVVRPHTVVVLTSPVHGEGVSTVATNLALALGEDEARVCLVEADLRAPSLGSLLDLEGERGLTSVLTGDAAVDDVVRPLGGNIDVVVAGARPPDPAELLGSTAMSDLIASLRDRYDIVLVDGPPVLPVADTPSLARQCDGAVVVTRAGRTTRTELIRTLAVLDAGAVPVLGTVLNGVPAVAAHRAPSLAEQPAEGVSR